MDNIKEILPGRLREAFGNDTQEAVAKKLVTQQGTVSKWITGAVVPPTDVLLLISEAYKVSVDWLLGISDEKEIDGVVLDKLTYEQVVKIIDRLFDKGTIMLPDLNSLSDNQTELTSEREGNDEDEDDGKTISRPPRYDSDYILINDRAISFMLRRRLKFMEIGDDAYGFWKDNIGNYAGIRLLNYDKAMQAAIDKKVWTAFTKDGDWVDALKELSALSKEELTAYTQKQTEKEGNENG